MWQIGDIEKLLSGSDKKIVEKDLIEALEYRKYITDTIPIGVIRTNENGDIIFANKQAQNSLGLLKENITRLSYQSPEWKITDIKGEPIHEKDLPFSIVKRTKKSLFRYRHAIEWPGGKKIFLSINASPVLDNKNNFLGIIASIENITTLVNHENLIKENYHFRNTIINNASEGICVCQDTDYYPFMKFSIWNNKMIEITGYTMDEINKLGYFQSLFPDPVAREMASKRIKLLKSGGGIIDEEMEIVRKSGAKRILNVNASAISQEVDKMHFMALMNDVTEKHQYDRVLKASNKKLEELNATKDKFFSILAHDLKNPFGAILGVVELLEESIDRGDIEAIKRSTNILRRSSQKGYDLLINLLDWSRTQTGKIKFSPEWVSLYSLVKENIELLDNISIQKKIDIIHRIDNDIKIYVDKNMLNTVLRNLLSNALKYSRDGGEIILRATPIEGFIKVTVKDSGVGIKKEDVTRLFNLDSNFTTIGTANETGTGLGLIVCKEFIEKHKGKIEVKSTPGRGSEFSFSVPYNSKDKATTTEPEVRKQSPETKNKILVVEDEEVNYFLMKEILSINNIPFVHAKNGKEAVAVCMEDKDISLVLMDIKMPVMDGYVATSIIKEKHPDLPVVALTAYDIDPDKRYMFDNCLTKPIEKKLLLNVLFSLLNE